jgi:predicted glycoside hydrolase/deacetylase ChbG (UPF0249 family)
MDDEKLLIVNADDFGLSPEANAGIVRAHREGIVTSTTLMANMPGFREAVELAAGCPGLGLGLHINLTDGPPDSLLPGLAGLMVRAWWSEAAMRLGIAAQVEIALAAGVRITHLDSHKHVHVHPSVLSALIWAAKEYGIGAVRVPVESRRCWAGAPLGWKVRSALVSVNALRVRHAARREGLAVTDHFVGTARTCNWDPESMAAVIDGLKPGVTELMVHPDDVQSLVSSEVRSAVKSAGVRLMTYADLRPTSYPAKP